MNHKYKAFFLVLPLTVLSACGNGASSDPAPSASPSALSPPTATVFAEPSGVLCTNMVGSDCVEPTAFGATPQQLLATLRDPLGPTFRLTRFGSSTVTHTKTSNGILTEGSSSYASLEKLMVFGRNQIQVDGKTYAFASTLANGDLVFRASATDQLLIPPMNSVGVVLSQYNPIASAMGVGTPNLEITVDSYTWLSFFGVLTDRAVVSIPANNLIQYSGSITFIGGDGTPFPMSSFGRNTRVSCPINMTLNTMTGRLSTSNVNCTDSSGTSLTFTQRDLYIDHSRVSRFIGDEATAFTSGPAYPGNSANPAVPRLDVTFTSNRVGGAVYGPNGQYLSIQGSALIGQFIVTALRQ